MESALTKPAAQCKESAQRLESRPYPLTIEPDGQGGVIVSDNVTLVYGWGDTTAEALDDYDVSLAEWREWEAMTPDERAAWTAQAAAAQAAELGRSGGA